MTLPELSLRRPVLAIVANLLIVIAGAAAILALPIRELPDVDTAQVTVSVDYEGAAPEVVDAEITTVIEGAIAGISGIRSISSESERGSNRTVIEFEAGTDIDVAANDVRAEVGRVTGDLPEEAEDPEIAKNDSESEPVVRLSLTSQRMSTADLTDYADRFLVDRIATIDGVSQVTIEGEQAYAMRIWLDRQAMAARGVTIDDVTSALENNNLELPAGEIESASRQFQVRTDTRLSQPAEFEALPVGGSPDYPIRLGEIATVERGVENDDSLLRANFQSAVGLGIQRQSQSNTVAISAAVEALLPELQETLPPGTTIAVSTDDAVFIEASIHEVLITLAITIALVVAVIYGFLTSLRATLVPAVAIPIAIVGACAGLAIFGFSINILTLFALVLAIGLVVDDAIVVLENIERRIGEGEDPLAAAALGTRQVVFAVIATTAVLVAVFVPLSFLQGQAGRLFNEFGIALAFSVIISSFVALTVCPLLAARLLRPKAKKSAFTRLIDGLFEALSNGYRRVLRLALAAPFVVLGLAAFVGALAYPLYERLPAELTPEEDRGTFFVNVEGPLGVNLSYTDAVVDDVEAILQPLVEEGLATNVTSIVGRWGEVQSAFIIVQLIDWSERDVSLSDVIARVEPPLEEISAADIRVGSPAGLGLRGSNNPLQVEVGGPDFADVQEWSETLRRAMQAEEGLTNVESDFEPNQPGYRIEVDRERIRDLGLSAADVSEALRVLLASAEVTEYADDGRQYPVIVQARDADRSRPSDITAAYVRTDAGELVPLAGLVEVQSLAAPRALNRYDRLPSVQVSAGLAEGMDLGAAIARVEALAKAELPPEAQIGFAGQALEFQDTSGGVLVVFGIALVIVFLVLAAQFESFIHPIIIILTVPLGISGALGTLLLAGQSLNIYSQVGLVLLVGLMAKNGILIVEFANQLRDEGKSVREAALEAAAVRLRPILMTVLSTVLGALPLVLASGAGAESRIAIGTVILGGLAVSAALTLFVTPVLYDLLAPLARATSAAAKDLDRALDVGDDSAAAELPATR